MRQTPGKRDKVKIGVVGGLFGRQFVFDQHPNCIVAAVCEAQPERCQALRQAYQCSVSYPSLEEMLTDKNVEAVGIFSGAHDHARHTLACLAAGKHVFCGVPAAQSIEDCEAIRDAVKKTGLTYMMAETTYYRPETIAAREFYQDGSFGDIFMCTGDYYHPGIEELFFPEGETTPSWRYGRPPFFQGTHCSAYYVGVTGHRLTVVSAQGRRGEDECYRENIWDNNPFCQESALFQTETGGNMRLCNSWIGTMPAGVRGSWLGTKMSLYSPVASVGPAYISAPDDTGAEDDAGFAQHHSGMRPYELPKYHLTDRLPEPLHREGGHGNSHAFLTHEFVSAVIEGRTPAIGLDVAMRMQTPVLAAHQSALQGGKLLTVPDIRL